MIVMLAGCEKEGADLEAKVKAYEAEKAKVMANLTRLDQLDFDAFSKQDWKLFNEIHCQDVLVKFPDGHETKGLKQHDEDIAALFVATPDMRISAHPVSFGSGEWVSTSPDKRASAQSPDRRGVDGHRQHLGSHLYQTNAVRRQDRPANGQEAQAAHGHCRSLEERLHCRRAALLGQRGLYATAWVGEMTFA